MADNNLILVKKDITYILQLNKKIQYHNKNNVKKARDMILDKQLFKTVLGQKYLVRLDQIIYGTENSYACVLCGKDLDNSTLVCGRCQEKYKLITPEQAAAARKAAQARKIMAARKAAEAQKIMAAGKAAEAQKIMDAGKTAEIRKIITARKAAEAQKISANHNAAETREVPKEKAAIKAAAATHSQTTKTPEPSASAGSKLTDLLTNLFKEHTREEVGEIFTAGTAKTMPPEYGQADVQPKPWLFLRIFVALMIAFGFLYICAAQLRNFNTISGLLFLGAAAFPFSILILMYETNTPRNISIFDVMKMFFAGSMAALFLITITFDVFPIGQLSYSGAVIVGFIEELVKILVIIIFIRLINPKYILNGLLIGAAVGAGFSVFESVGYTFRFYLLSGGSIDYLTDIILLRAWSSLGSHTMWGAIAGGGLLAAKTDNPFSFKLFYNPKFLSKFIVLLIFHSVWNCPFMDSGSSVYIKLIVLTVLAWTVMLSLLTSGISQFENVCYAVHVDQEGADA